MLDSAEFRLLRYSRPRDGLRSKPLRVGVVGCGVFGTYHAEAWCEVLGANLRAVCDIVHDRVRLLSARTGTLACTSIDQLPDDLDCVSIAVEPQYLETAAAQCLARGLHVQLEKPFSLSPRSASRLLGIAAEHRLVLKAGYVEAFHPAFLRAMEMLPEPSSLFSRRRSCPRPGVSGVGVILDLMSHDIEHAVALGGDISDVKVETDRAAMPGTRSVRALLSFKSGFSADIEATYCTEQRVRQLTLSNAQRAVTVDLLSSSIHSDTGEEKVLTGNPLASQFASFVDCITTRKSARGAGRRAVQVLQIAEMITAAASGGDRIVRLAS